MKIDQVLPAKLLRYLPIALRAASTVVAFLTPAYAARWQISPEVGFAMLGAGAAAWKKWHESASVAAILPPPTTPEGAGELDTPSQQ